MVRTVDESTLVPDESLTIDQGAVLPWQTLMWSLMKDIARDLGVRTDVPFCRLTPKERDIVFNGPAVKHHMVYQNRTNGAAGDPAAPFLLTAERLLETPPPPGPPGGGCA